ncbi:MAG: hypothetical protein ACO3DQ_02325 [Cephaloticoccus sp.]
MKFALPLVLSTLAGLLLGGCATPLTFTERIKAKAAAYAALNDEQRALVEAGGIATGYTSDQVFIAYGKPSKIQQRDTEDGPIIIWTYKRFYPTSAVAATWSVSRQTPTAMRVLFYQDRVFEVALERVTAQPISDPYADNDMSGQQVRTDPNGGSFGGTPPASTRPE